MSRISLIVPVFHNARSLPPLVEKFQQLAARNADDSFEFILVDDGSQDRSFEVMRELAAAEPRLKLVKLSRNFGSNAALMVGLNQAAGDVVAAIAADLQDPPELIHDMLEQWRGGRKVVLAARKGRDDPFLTALLADTFYALFRRFAVSSMPDRGFDFFLVDRQVCDLINSIEEANSYLMGLILWLGFDPAILYYDRQQRKREFGSSMWTLAKKLKYFVDAFVAFSHIPVRAASLIGAGLGALGLVYAVVLVFMQLFLGASPQGWTSLMVVLLIVSGAQMMMLGVLGEYLCRSLDETRRRPRFVIDHVEQAAKPMSEVELDRGPEAG